MTVIETPEPSASVPLAQRPRRVRVGVYGGSFDPPHNAHVQIAQLALEQLALDRLLVVPTGAAWYKARPLTVAHHRLAMCQLAFSAIPQVIVDEREMNRSGPSYTIDTLRELNAEQPDADFFLILGADQAARLPTWHDWQAIIQGVQLAVVDRATNQADAAPNASPHWLDVFEACKILQFVQLETPPMTTNATQLRDQIRRGEINSPTTFSSLAPQVARYISQHQLYKALP